MAAYLCFSREIGAKVARTKPVAPGLLVDYGAHGEPMGLEITAPPKVTVDRINAVLKQLRLPVMDS